MSNKPITNAKVKLSGTSGNAFVILGEVSIAIQKSDKPELVEQFLKEAKSGDYDHLLDTCFKYVEVD
jgi:hypothetical protein